MSKLIPLLLGLVGLASGVAAGHFLKPPAEKAEEPRAALERDKTMRETTSETDHAEMANYDYVRLNKQFIVPIVRESAITSLVILSLSIEIEPGGSDGVFEREPKLRDAFLQALFLHAQSGGFSGAFTSGQAMRDLRGALRRAAIKVIGPTVNNVLVTEIVRQDL